MGFRSGAPCPASPVFAALAPALPPSPALGPGAGRSFAEIASTSRAEVVPAKAKRGETVTYKLTIEPKPGAWTYPIKSDDRTRRRTNVLEHPAPADLIFVDRARSIRPAVVGEASRTRRPGSSSITHSKGDRDLGVQGGRLAEGDAGQEDVSCSTKDTTLQVCNEPAASQRLDGNDLPVAEFEVLDGDPVPVERAVQGRGREGTQRRAQSRRRARPRDADGSVGPLASRNLPRSPASRKAAKPAEQVEAELKTVLDSLDKTRRHRHRRRTRASARSSSRPRSGG